MKASGIMPRKRRRGQAPRTTKEVIGIKHGVNPTRSQKKLLAEHRLNPKSWMVVKDTPEAIELVHRNSDKTRRVIRKI